MSKLSRSTSSSAASSTSSSSLVSSITSSLSTPKGRLIAGGVAVAAAAAGFAAWYWRSSKRAAAQQPLRPLHWVFKVHDLERSVEFYSSILGLTVQRHEEFASGCEATCNGPFGGAYSKTMMSLTTEADFSLELIYNYGVTEYKKGNDLLGLHVYIPGALERARARGITVHDTHDAQVYKIQNPDGEWIWLHQKLGDLYSGVQEKVDPFLYVSLSCVDVYAACDYYANILGMQVFESSPTSCTVGSSMTRTKIQFHELPSTVPIDHGTTGGRIAFGCGDVQNYFERIVAAKERVLHKPMTLTTPNKPRVLVTIVLDRDGHEICLVDEFDFRKLSSRKRGDEVIDWEERKKKIEQQKKFEKSSH